eukprot:TRINITY_DN5364_c0_g1_i1.p1 TRINITY_DN5364_c0_g1~~TRINITY_DN5364_c0_g1_i1.p1  ORF type:complete len:334 (+),score=67.68 TRINITY_DN5364_c0_g1_i1:62-1063(+)
MCIRDRYMGPGLVLARCGISVMACLSLQAPLIADYVHDRSKGLAAGILTFSLMFGAVLGAVILSVFVKDFSFEFIYSLYATILVFGVGVNFITIRGGNYHLKYRKPKVQGDAQPKEQSNLLKDMMIGFSTARNPWILIAFALTFLIGIYLPMGSKIFAVWVQSFYGQDDAAKEAARSRVASLGIYTQSSNLVMTFVGSLLIDRISKFAFLFLGYGMQLAGILVQLLTQNPESALMPVCLALQSSGNAALSLIHTFLMSKYAPAEHRGKVFGTQTSIMAFGAIVSGVVGGFLFDVQKDIPYLIFGVVAAIISVISFGYFATQSKWNKEEQLPPT